MYKQVVEVANFLRSMPDVRMTVGFDKTGAGHVIERSGCTDTGWDKQAINAARKLLSTE